MVGKKHPSEIKFGNRVDGKEVFFEFAGHYPIKVREDREGWLRLFDGHREGWADKDQFVLSRDATAYFTDRLGTNPSDEFAWWGRGLAWLDREEYDKAIKDFTECIRLDPKDAAAFNSRGIAWADKKEYDKAIARLQRGHPARPQGRRRLQQPRHRLVRQEGVRQGDRRLQRGHPARPEVRHAPSTTAASPGLPRRSTTRRSPTTTEAIRLDPEVRRRLHRPRRSPGADKKEYDKAIARLHRGHPPRPQGRRRLQQPRHRLVCTRRSTTRRSPTTTRPSASTPSTPSAFYNRSVAQMLSRQPKAVGGFQTVLDLQGWKGDRALYAVILGHFAARQDGDEAAAKRFLSDSAGKLSEDWPYPVVRFLRGEIDEPALLKLAIDDDKRTEARCYLGLDHLLKGRKDEALAHFRWVKEHGTADFTEYTIAIAELERLERGEK